MKKLLTIAGLLHFAILTASALTPAVFDWSNELESLHPFLRNLFWVYGGFIVLVIVSFGILTLRFAGEMAAGERVARGLAAFIAVFWGARLGVQFFVFDPSPFLVHWTLHAGYHGLTVVFLFLAMLYGVVASGKAVAR